MHNFPVPYPNELLYSTVARAGVYQGITSPKQLLDEVFNDRKVVATLDLPCHVQALAQQLRRTGRFSIQELIYQHTLFPIYSPFITEARKKRAIQLMTACSQGAIHLLLGVAASRVQVNDYLRYCPECLKRQYQQYGEHFWLRSWFFPGLQVCPEHGALTILPIRTSAHRHQFHSLTSLLSDDVVDAASCSELIQLARFASQLLTIPFGGSPSLEQWTSFYRNLAVDFRLSRGNHIRHDEIYERVIHQFQKSTLAQLHLQLDPTKDSSWLKNIFRKHRKTFSYLEHGIVWLSFLVDMKPDEIIQHAHRIATCAKVFTYTVKSSVIEQCELNIKRRLWQKLVRKNGVLGARKLGSGNALYAWLYRNDTPWLLNFNSEHKMRRTNPEQKLNWHLRDLNTVRQLYRLLPAVDVCYTGPRLSANFLLTKLKNKSTIEKNLSKLPLVSMFLARYAETVTEYQLRRLVNTCIELSDNSESLKKWVVLRKAGLSEERLCADTQKVLAEMKLF
ncbi:TnsD family Tn7-like transposition protein [Shewanella fodinae]|uniref:Tn7-like transposition protein D n=1 Tax=Shewanella fodinae TaxID=552357 RepID=A0A4R2FI13_9GAMM|nr:TnsD family Tn7-like transposition protein [Shewanella fodinae]TCN86835.1 Tn7-like transposition protein D [Shewanella fodinae]